VVAYLRGSRPEQSEQRERLVDFAAKRGWSIHRVFADELPPSPFAERGLTDMFDATTDLMAEAGRRRLHTIVLTTTYRNLSPGRVGFVFDCLLANDCGVRYLPLDVKIGNLRKLPRRWSRTAHKITRDKFTFESTVSERDVMDQGPFERLLRLRGFADL
jgi:hypothetical protein